MKPLSISFLIWLCLLSPRPTVAAPPTATIHLQVSGITQQAPLIVLLFRNDGWLHAEQAIQQLRIPAGKHDPLSCTLVNIPYPNRYAIEAFLDLNDNGRLDMHWLPFPGPDEPVGFSNHYAPSGRPSFAKASFNVNTGKLALSIHLR